MLLCYVVDKLHNKYGLTNTRTAEQTDLTALKIRGYKVNYLDSRFKNLVGGSQLLILRGLAVDFPTLLGFGGRLIVYRFAQQVEDTSESFFAYRYGYRFSCVYCLCSAYQTVRAAHSYTAYKVVADMLCHLHNKLFTVVVDFDGVK